MIRKEIICLVTAIVLSICAPLSAQQWDQQFCHNAVNNIYLRGDTLWCCTDGGILTYNLADSLFSHYGSGLKFRSTHADVMTFDSEGNIWVGFEAQGIVRIEDPLASAEMTWYSAETGLIDDHILEIESVGDEIYYGCEKGIGKFFEELPSREAIISDFLENEEVYDILALNDSIFWIASGAGITRFNRLSLQYDHYQVHTPVVSVCLYQGGLYCASTDSIYTFDGQSWSFLSSISEVDGASNASAFVKLDSDENQFYCITEFACYQWQGSWWSAVDRWGMKSLFTAAYRSGWNFEMRALEIDGTGNPWIGAIKPNEGRGVNLYLYDWADSQWVNRRPEQITYNDISKVALDPSGGVWISPVTNGISYYSPYQGHFAYTSLDEGSGVGLSSIHTNLAILCDSNDRFWCHAFGDPALGSSFPLDMIELGERISAGDDSWSHFTRGEHGISIRHQNAVEDPAGNIWFLSDDLYPEEGGEGLDIISSSANQWIHINPDNTSGLPSGNIADCAFTGTEAYLAVKNYGVVVWETGSFEWSSLSGGGGGWYPLVFGYQLPSEEISALELRGGTLWIATSAGLVRRSSNGNLRKYSTGELERSRRLLSNNVNDIALDRYGKLWVASDNGLNVIGQDGAVVAAYTSFDRWNSTLSGLYPYSIISPLVSSVCNSICYDSSVDRVWVGTRNGLMGIDADISLFSGSVLTEAILYPNPVITGEGDSGVYISRIGDKVDIEVFNIEGELVHRQDNVGDGEEVWDLLTMNGFRAESGVYLVRISNEESYELRKVAVIR
ncbi:MAG: T9SS type A sorting domain-containing protein [Candidatus Latescibacteria bacterium]|nr:T9SS type A sorting domain-containing protein [bacterium]MBD3422875.1 T9SS type A sorting domain-containing protein [Candidatus Latescibacterota bacterium]